MPYEDEIPPWAEQWQPPPELNELSGRVIGAAMEVHDKLGPGLPEDAYQRALEMEFTARGIPFQSQFRIEIRYKGKVVCQGRVDFLIDGRLILEIKSIELLAPIHKKQVLAYLWQTQLHLGLLINFNVSALKDGIRRIIRS